MLPLKKVLRKATPADFYQLEDNKRKEEEAFRICQKIAKHKLEMKLIKVEYTFDRNKIIFYFTAEGGLTFVSW